MSLNRYAKKRDLMEEIIISALVSAGCDVVQSDLVDLIVGRAGRNYLLEIKNSSKSRLTPSQLKFRETWRGQYTVVFSTEQALRAVGL